MTRLIRGYAVKQGYFEQNFSLISLFTPTYFAVCASCSELEPTQTFTVMHGKVSPWSQWKLINNQNSHGAILIKSFLMQIKKLLKACFQFPQPQVIWYPALSIARARSQPRYIVNRKLET